MFVPDRRDRESMGGASDRELIDRARRGESDAFGLLVRRHQRRIYRLAAHMLRNSSEAEDVTQEVFVRAYQALDRFDGRSEPFTWIYRIAVNLALNHIRAKKTRSRASSGDDPRMLEVVAESRVGMPSDPSADGDRRRMADALYDGIDALSDTLRTTLILVCIDGLSHEAAAEVLGCPEGTIAWRVHEARRKLKAHMASKGYEGELE
jgi:RNA polymerase sigma-70 factor (ECF subfamily)